MDKYHNRQLTEIELGIIKHDLDSRLGQVQFLKRDFNEIENLLNRLKSYHEQLSASMHFCENNQPKEAFKTYIIAGGNTILLHIALKWLVKVNAILKSFSLRNDLTLPSFLQKRLAFNRKNLPFYALFGFVNYLFLQWMSQKHMREHTVVCEKFNDLVAYVDIVLDQLKNQQVDISALVSLKSPEIVLADSDSSLASSLTPKDLNKEATLQSTKDQEEQFELPEAFWFFASLRH